MRKDINCKELLKTLQLLVRGSRIVKLNLISCWKQRKLIGTSFLESIGYVMEIIIPLFSMGFVEEKENQQD